MRCKHPIGNEPCSHPITKGNQQFFLQDALSWIGASSLKIEVHASKMTCQLGQDVSGCGFLADFSRHQHLICQLMYLKFVVGNNPKLSMEIGIHTEPGMNPCSSGWQCQMLQPIHQRGQNDLQVLESRVNLWPLWTFTCDKLTTWISSISLRNTLVEHGWSTLIISC